MSVKAFDKEGTWYSNSGVLCLFTSQRKCSATCLRPFSTSVAPRNCIHRRAASLHDWVIFRIWNLCVALPIPRLLGAVCNLVIISTTPIAFLRTVSTSTRMHMPTLIPGLNLLSWRNLYSFTPFLCGVEVSESLIPLSTWASLTKFLLARPIC